MDLKIRKAEVADAPLIAATERLIAQTPGFLLSRPEELKIESFAETITRLQKDPRGYYRVGLNREIVIGHCLLEPLPREVLRHVLSLTVAIHPDFQGQGFGRALLGDALWWAKCTKGVEKIELKVRSTNTRALALYHSAGFKEEGRLTRHVRLAEDLYLDEIVMGLPV